MHTSAFFNGLFEYNQHVNHQMIHFIGYQQDASIQRIIDLAAHIQLVHLSWNNRLQNQEGLTDFWSRLSVQQLFDLNVKNNQKSLDIIKHHEVNDSVSYKNSKGTEFTNTCGDILFHVINHSSYHRGQINAELRKSGLEPVNTEYIFYKR